MNASGRIEGDLSTTKQANRKIRMKTIFFPQYGSPDVLQLIEKEKPTPQEGQVLVKIHAASANPLDWHRLRGTPILARLSEGFRKPDNPTLGADIAGIVEAVGGGVSQFKPGDAVFGDVNAGGFAEYATARENQLTLKPDNLTFEAAAAVPVAAVTALQGLRDAGHIQSGQRVLVNGASGGAGTFAVQIAKSFGAEVTGVCSTRNLDMVRSIGADHVVDYTREDFTTSGQQYDLVFDAVGNLSIGAMGRALTPNGRAVVAGFTSMARLFAVIILGGIASRRGTKKFGLMGTAQMNQADLRTLADMLAAGTIVPVIDKRYPLEQTAEAIRYLETGHARGKVIITVVPTPGGA
jgi:NADPH:quinone reductase-like Zn-dependent oxidoreductase